MQTVQTQKIFIIGNNVCMKRGLDAERFRQYFMANGYEITTAVEEADKIFVITCSFLKSFENTAVDQIQELSKYKGKMIVYGCLPNMAPDRFKTVFSGDYLATKDMDEIDTLFPEFTTPFSEIPDAHLPYNPAIAERDDNYSGSGEIKVSATIKKISPILRICYGCSGHCTYCQHPQSLGGQKSKPIDECVDEYQRIISGGDTVVNIHANDPGAYGIDIGSTYPELLHALIQNTSVPSVKLVLSDINPRWLHKYRDEIGDIIKTGIVKGLGVPLQSGSQKVLKRMGRIGYVVEQTIETLKRFKESHPSLAISTHIIVGFPGESESDFDKTLALFNDGLFNSVLLFKYSDKKGTPAAKFDNHLPDDVVNDRMKLAIDTIKPKVKFLRDFF